MQPQGAFADAAYDGSAPAGQPDAVHHPEVCKALAYAHDLADPETGKPLGIVHRDISPPNILFRSVARSSWPTLVWPKQRRRSKTPIRASSKASSVICRRKQRAAKKSIVGAISSPSAS